jgi:hypothetical protein
MRSDPERSCGSTSLRPSAPELKQQPLARRCHICTATGLTPATSAAQLGSPRPHLRRDCAHPAHICTRTKRFEGARRFGGKRYRQRKRGTHSGTHGVIEGYSRGTRGVLTGYYGVLWGGTLRGPVPCPSPRGAGRSLLGVHECACDPTSPVSPGADVGPQERGVSPNPAPDEGRWRAVPVQMWAGVSPVPAQMWAAEG